MQISSIGDISKILSQLQIGRSRPAVGSNQAQALTPVQPVENEENATPATLENPIGLEGLAGEAAVVRAFTLSQSQTEFSALGDGFQVRGSSQSFALDLSLQQGDQLLQLNVEITRSVIGVAVGSGLDEGASGGNFLDGVLGRLPAPVRETVEGLLSGGFASDFFSPTATGDRIADFALGGFSFFEGGAAAAENSQESRQRFADFILPAISQGIQEALDILGELPDRTAREIDETRSQIDQRFDEFLGGGVDVET